MRPQGPHKTILGGYLPWQLRFVCAALAPRRPPFYRVVVADSRFPRDGRFIEEIGTYDPNKEPSEVKIDAEKAKQWIANGAQPLIPFVSC